MSPSKPHSWQSIQATIRERIQNRTWQPGDLIPAEVELANEFGCSRTTVNRALRELAAAGVVDRKRKAGTRVSMQLARKVTGEIPIIRTEVEQRGARYQFDVLEKRRAKPGAALRESLALTSNSTALHIKTLHLANDTPFMYEDRWVNTASVPDIADIDFDQISVNEWLVGNIPFTRGEFVVTAHQADRAQAKLMNVKTGSALLLVVRSTWIDDRSVTTARMHYAADYQMTFAI